MSFVPCRSIHSLGLDLRADLFLGLVFGVGLFAPANYQGDVGVAVAVVVAAVVGSDVAAAHFVGCSGRWIVEWIVDEFGLLC